MKRHTWAVVTTMGLGLAVQVRGDNPPLSDTQGAYEETTTSPREDVATGELSTLLVAEVSAGAASMEPADSEMPEQRSDRVWVESIWSSP